MMKWHFLFVDWNDEVTFLICWLKFTSNLSNRKKIVEQIDADDPDPCKPPGPAPEITDIACPIDYYTAIV